MRTLVADVGGTSFKVGLLEAGKLVKTASFPTDCSGEAARFLKSLAAGLKEVAGAVPLDGVALGLPGPVVGTTLKAAQNLRLWEPIDFAPFLAELFPGAKALVVNDVNAATAGEYAYGAARAFETFIFIALGTGVGGGVMVDGRLITGFSGAGGEIGHLRVGFNNTRLCNCGLYDCLETYASATGLVQTAYEQRFNQQTALNDLARPTAKDVGALALAGDPVAENCVALLVEKLATGLSQACDLLNPEAVVIGGGVSQMGEYLREKVEKRLNELAFYAARGIKVLLSERGIDTPLYGLDYLLRSAK